MVDHLTQAAATERDRLIANILDRLPPEDHHRLVPVVRGGPDLYERLTGDRPHPHLLLRHCRDGILGVRLTSVCAGRRLLTTARWVAEHLVDVGAARFRHPEAQEEPGTGERR